MRKKTKKFDDVDFLISTCVSLTLLNEILKKRFGVEIDIKKVKK